MNAKALKFLVALCGMSLCCSAWGGKEIRLAAATTVVNSGLMKFLLPAFEAESGFHVQVIPVGTGKALKLGESGDVDVILAHSRPDEERFVAERHGVMRRAVMHNDFVVAGPAADPAAVRGTGDVAAALKKIAGAGAKFVSRGDDSGTHRMELRLWNDAGVKPQWRGYLSAGQGMGEALLMAGEMQAYILTDRGTFTAYRARTGLEMLAGSNPPLLNHYGVIAVNPKKSPGINYEGATAFIHWLISPAGQERISDFKVGGEQLFFPDAE